MDAACSVSWDLWRRRPGRSPQVSRAQGCWAALCSFISLLCIPRSPGGTELIPARRAPTKPWAIARDLRSKRVRVCLPSLSFASLCHTNEELVFSFEVSLLQPQISCLLTLSPLSHHLSFTSLAS